jgi:hypothetical protein
MLLGAEGLVSGVAEHNLVTEKNGVEPGVGVGVGAGVGRGDDCGTAAG